MPAAIAKTTEAKPMAKPVKEKKAKSAKAAASPPSHPPYFEMIKDAITALHERTGSSSYAIAKHMEDKYKGQLPANFKKILANQLKGFAAKGKLVKVKASFKLSDSGKKEVKPVKVKKPVAVKAKKPVVEKVKKVKKAEVVKAVKAGTKRKAPAAAVAKPKPKKTVAKSPMKVKKVAKSPAKAKKPKSIKSPAAKKARVSKA